MQLSHLACPQMEFAVQMTCQKCVNAIHNSLDGAEGMSNYCL